MVTRFGQYVPCGRRRHDGTTAYEGRHTVIIVGIEEIFPFFSFLQELYSTCPAISWQLRVFGFMPGVCQRLSGKRGWDGKGVSGKRSRITLLHALVFLVFDSSLSSISRTRTCVIKPGGLWEVAGRCVGGG